MYDYDLGGLGITGSQTVGIATSAGGTALSIASVLAIGGGPVGMAVGGAISIVSTLIGSLFQPNVQKIQASNDANQIEPIMQQNLNNWLSIPTNQRYQSVQAAALNVFNQAWQQYVQLTTPLLSKAPNSISDRQSGSCAYHTAQCAGWSGNTYTPSGPNQSTGCCWNWFVGYYDPIANDPNVIPDPTTSAVEGVTGAISSLVGGNNSMLLFAGLAVVLGGIVLANS